MHRAVHSNPFSLKDALFTLIRENGNRNDQEESASLEKIAFNYQNSSQRMMKGMAQGLFLE